MTLVWGPFRAEWIKVVGHRRVTGMLLWIFPVTALVVVALFALVAVVDPGSRAAATRLLGTWTDVTLLAWTILGDPFGRVLLIGFTAFVFAGEHAWGTWKNIAPRRRRSSLVLAKVAVLFTLVMVAFAFVSLILLAGSALIARVVDAPLTPALTRASLGDFLPDYLLAAALALVAFLITANLTALAAIASRSILGGTLTGILLVFVEPVLLVLPRWLASFFEAPALLHLARLLPGYHLENVAAWVTTDRATALLERSYRSLEVALPADGLAFSALALGAWVLLGLGAILVVFARQDITS